MFAFVIFAVILGVFIYNWYFSEKAVIKRKFKKTQHKKISEFEEGHVAKYTGVIESIDEP